MSCVRIPQFTTLEVAIKLFRTRVELSNADIEALFGKHSSSTVAKLKKLARDKMTERSIMSRNPRCVNTEAAYEAWGLDISDLEYRYQKLKELKIH